MNTEPYEDNLAMATTYNDLLALIPAICSLENYPAFWVNRQKLQVEKLDGTPDGAGNKLTQLVRFLESL